VSLVQALSDFRPDGEVETADVIRVRALADAAAAGAADPWARDSPLHATCSALVVHPPTGRVLLRWHDRLGRWLHVGGHADPGEDRPYAIAWREAHEETGLDDLVAWPEPDRPQLVQVVVVPVPAVGAEPAHEHADLRYLLATAKPEQAEAETATTPLRWLTIDAALDLVGNDNLAVALHRTAASLGPQIPLR
jgi:8-oxo-dGTP pyrophosphatase MutT (NUDIX family)